MPPPSRMTASAMRVELQRGHPRRGGLPHGLQRRGDQRRRRRPSRRVRRRCAAATTLRPRSPGRPIIGLLAERLQRPREDLVEAADGVDGLQLAPQ